MVTARDIKTHSGILLVPKGQELNEEDLRRLVSYDNIDPIVSGIFVISAPVDAS